MVGSIFIHSRNQFEILDVLKAWVEEAIERDWLRVIDDAVAIPSARCDR